MRFADKTVLVTGGTSGIGREASIAFAREGARVIFTGRDTARGEAVAAEIANVAGECLFFQHDVAAVQSWIDTLAIIKDRFGSLDVLVNNAGIFTHGPIENTSLEDFQAMWQTNVNSVFLGMKYAMPLLQAGSGKGAILNVSSLSGLVGHADVVSYCTTKAASIMLTRVMAMEAALRCVSMRLRRVRSGTSCSSGHTRARTPRI